MLSCFLVGGKAFSQSQNYPGVLFPLEQIVSTQTNKLAQVTTKATANQASLSNLDESKGIKIDENFLRIVLIHTQPSYMALARKSSCTFYAALENGLIRSNEGIPRNIPIWATAKGKSEPELFAISTENFLQITYKKECASNRDITNLFNLKNLKKTMDGFSFAVPKSESQCTNILNEWRTNSYLPYLCGVHEKVDAGNKADIQLTTTPASDLLTRRVLGTRVRVRNEINELTSLFQRNYVSSLCQSFDDQAKFCAPFLSEEVWPKIIAGERPPWLINRLCEVLYNKTPINGRDLVSCANKLKNEPELCTSLGAKAYPALFPKANCQELSDALLVSKLVTQYRDCPGSLNNGTMTNGYRLLAHYQNTAEYVSPIECAQKPSLAYAQISLKTDPKEGWPLAVCYTNRAREQRECMPYVPGPHESSEMAENAVIKKILVANYGMGSNDQCRIVRGDQYNPSLLEFKNGCFIVYLDNVCTLTHCRRQIVFNSNQVQGIEFTGQTLFSYFPDSIAQTKSTLQSLLQENLRTEAREIRNLTELTFYLNDIPNSIIHGIGCAEEIIPSFYQRTTLNQCTPLPFILDGISKRGSGDDIVIRTAIDEIHSPRLVPWNFIFNSVASFQQHHLLKTWTLYGLKI